MSGFGGGGVDDGFDGCNNVGGESAFGGVFADEVFVGGDVDAVDLVGCDIGMDPLNLWAQLSEDTTGGLGDGSELLGGKLAGFGNVALDEELWHWVFLRGGVVFAACTKISGRVRI